MTNIINFYLGKIPDSNKRYLSDILSFNNSTLETDHFYIQWLFPLEQPSNYNTQAPLLVASDRIEFAKNKIVRTNVLKSFNMMLEFYGFINKDSFIVINKPLFDQKKQWLTPNNHNFLRITRIITSMRLMGFISESDAFRKCVLNISNMYPHIISADTKKYWALA